MKQLYGSEDCKPASKWYRCVGCGVTQHEDDTPKHEVPSSVDGFTDTVCRDCTPFCDLCDDWIDDASITRYGIETAWSDGPCHQNCYDEFLKEIREEV